ncbi:alpha/beta fold hydrolase [Actinomadura kijaniata]|uniref:alpha/beta fold hydrolase n=1 Tax=Actinomadura kijaniata TaxID=46161 RepID=UPI003F1B6761
MAGTVLGLATNLYSAEFRQALTTSGRWLSSTVLSALLVAAVSSASAIVLYRLLVRRRVIHELRAGEFTIGADALQYIDDEHDSVVGRSLHYLEVERDSPELVVFLHGLGLDADDFQPYMVESKFHCIALTMFGFNAEEREDPHYRPIGLKSHLQLLSYALKKIRSANPRKNITVVGFSFGADMLLFLRRHAEDLVGGLDIKRAILLDPNVNHSTTTISSKVAAVTATDPLGELVNILHSAQNVNDLGYLCAYLRKITSKNFDQVRRHACDVVDAWRGDGYEQFLDRVGQLTSIVADVHIILSFSYEQQFNGMARAAQDRGLDISNLDCSRSGHFDLISPRFLRDRLEGLLYAP